LPREVPATLPTPDIDKLPVPLTFRDSRSSVRWRRSRLHQPRRRDATPSLAEVAGEKGSELHENARTAAPDEIAVLQPLDELDAEPSAEDTETCSRS
jgi:hypothetical protein